MPWIGDAGRGHVALRVDQLLEALLPQQLAVDDARRADLDDLVARRRVRGRWSRCRTRCRPARPAAGRPARASARVALEQVEVVVLGPAVAAQQRGGVELLAAAPASGSRKRKKAWWRTRSRSNQNSPPWRSHHVAHASAGWSRRRRASARSPSSSRSRCSSPGRSRPGRAARAAPAAAAGAADSADLVLVDQPRGQVGQRLQQREAVDLEPQRRRRPRCVPARSRAAPRCGAARPPPGRRRACPPAASASSASCVRARGQLLRCAGSCAAPRRAPRPWKRSRVGGVQVGVVEHLHRRLQVAQRRAAAFGEAVQQLVARRLVARTRA